MARHLDAFLIALSLLVATVWSTYPMMKSAYAAFKMPALDVSRVQEGDQAQILELKRRVQKHFLAYDVYIPIGDMMIASQVREQSGKLFQYMVNSCGKGRMAVWVPLRSRFPIFGDRVFEWCWKPPLKMDSKISSSGP